MKMTTLYYNGYHASEGTTTVSSFWSDVHLLDFRADKVITDHEVLKEQVERFKADRTQFDITDYSSHAKNIKAVRKYSCLIEKRVDFEKVVFEYQGKEYKIQTRKHTVVMKINKNADKIIEHKDVQTIALVDDESGEVIGIQKVLGEVEHYLDF